MKAFVRNDSFLLFLKYLLWFLCGIILATLMLGLSRVAFLYYLPIHPVSSKSVERSSISQFTLDADTNSTKVSNLHLVKTNQYQEKNQEQDQSKFQDIQLSSVEKIEESKLPLEVVGITYGPSNLRSVTLRDLENRTKTVLQVNQKWKGAKIKQIRRNEVLIRNMKKGTSEILPLKRGYNSLTSNTEKTKESTDKSKEISRFKVNEAIQYNMNNLLRSVKVNPAFKQGQIIGLKISELNGRPGELLKKLGFKTNDIITRVNGQKINDVDRALDLWTELRNMKNFKLRVLRNGEKKTFQYELTR